MNAYQASANPGESDAVNATIAVSAKGFSVANQRDITITLLDSAGVAIDYVEYVELIMLLNAGGTDFVVTGGSTGLAQGATGKLLPIVAKKIFRAISTIAGIVQVIYTDTGAEAGFLGVRLPNGRMVISTTM